MEKIKFNTNWLTLTYTCNNHCIWCYAAPDSAPLEFLDERYEKGIVDLLSSLKIKRTILIGGEPTLYPNLARIIKRIKEEEIDCGIVSNGRLFSDINFTKELKKSGLSSITFSIEGYNSESHDLITRTKGSFNQLVQGLENALSEGFYTSTNTVIDSSNSKDLEKIVDLVSNKVKVMTFNIRGVCISKKEGDTQILPLRESILAFQKTFQYAKSKEIKTRLVIPVPLCLFDSSYLEELKKERIVSGGPCQLTHGNNFVIDYNGDILPCTHLIDYPLFNIFIREEVMNGSDFRERYLNPNETPAIFRSQMRKYPSKKCDDGHCKESCSGGCPLLWTLFDPEKEIKGQIS
jgi:radical SAM protein with 4Fe4S-binding SPASM domain